MFNFTKKQADSVLLFSILQDASKEVWEKHMKGGPRYCGVNLYNAAIQLLERHSLEINRRQEVVLTTCCHAMESLASLPNAHKLLNSQVYLSRDPDTARNFAKVMAVCLKGHGVPVAYDEEYGYYSINADRLYEADWSSPDDAPIEGQPLKYRQTGAGAGGITPLGAQAADPLDEKEEACWAQALEEYESNRRQPGVWAQAFAETDGDELAAKARYLVLRVAQFKKQRYPPSQTTSHAPQAGAQAAPKKEAPKKEVAGSPESDEEKSPWKKGQPPEVHDHELMAKHGIDYREGYYYLRDGKFKKVWDAVQYDYYCMRLQEQRRDTLVPKPSNTAPNTIKLPEKGSYTSHYVAIGIGGTIIALLFLWIFATRDSVSTETMATATPPSQSLNSNAVTYTPNPVPPQNWRASDPEKEWIDTVKIARRRIKNRELAVMPMRVEFFSEGTNITNLPPWYHYRKPLGITEVAALERDNAWWVEAKNILNVRVVNSTNQPITGILFKLSSGPCEQAAIKTIVLGIDFSEPLPVKTERVYRGQLPMNYSTEYGTGRSCGVIAQGYAAERNQSKKGKKAQLKADADR